MFNFINTSRKFRGGENRKTEIQKKGVGGGRISLFVLFYYNLQRWSKGVGVLGSPVMPRPPCLAVLTCLSSAPPSRLLPKPRQADCLLQAVLVLLLGRHHALSQVVSSGRMSGFVLLCYNCVTNWLSV